jgi:hypothetical protein
MSRAELLALAASIVAAEEAARELARVAGTGAQPPQQQAAEATRVVRLRSVALPATLVDASGPGRLSELVVVSRTADFSLRVVVDGRILYDDSYSWFESISQLVEEIDAFSLDGSYALRLRDISFSRRLRVEASPVTVVPLSQPVVLDEVLCKLHVRG